MRNLVILVALALPPIAAAEYHGCTEAAPAAWVELRQKHRGTSTEADVEWLWAARVETCRRMKAGELSPAQARDEFERARSRVIRKWEEEAATQGAG